MSLPQPIPGLDQPRSGPLLDRFGRAHTYIRVSVTDRCNYRCTYCMPAEGLDWLPKTHLLRFEEIARLLQVLAAMGIERVRLTGGEPTIRRDLHRLVAMIAAIPGIDDIAMTTNGHSFGAAAEKLAAAGLNRINVSLDTLDPDRFAALTRGGRVDRVLASIEAARRLGLTPIKINCVVVGGTNDADVPAMVEHFAPHADDTIVRFIEYMPFDQDSRSRHVPSSALRQALSRRWTLAPDGPGRGGGPARNWRIAETGQQIGFISPMSEHFCDSCNRLRLQADGHLRTCLSRDRTPSLRDLLRAQASDTELEYALRGMVWQKVAGHEAHLDGDAFRRFEGVMTRVGG